MDFFCLFAVWPAIVMILANIGFQAAATGTDGYQQYINIPSVRVDESQDFLLGTNMAYCQCITACETHGECRSVNLRLDGLQCFGTKKTFYSFGCKISIALGWIHYSPTAIEVRDGDWILVFRAPSRVDPTWDERRMMTAWNNDSLRSDDSLSSLNPACFSNSREGCTEFFRSRWLTQWPANIYQVRLALYTGGQLSAEMMFDGQNSTRDTWYDTYRLLSSTWTDMIPGDPNNLLSIHGQLTQFRVFVATRTMNEDDCNQLGWLLVAGRPGSMCIYDYDSAITMTDTGYIIHSPQFLYSPTSSMINFNTGDYGLADVMAIFIKLN